MMILKKRALAIFNEFKNEELYSNSEDEDEEDREKKE